MEPDPKTFEGNGKHTTIYRTKIDDMLDLVKVHQKIKVNHLVNKLETPAPQVIQWGKMLEKNHLLDIYYPPIGDPEFRINGKPKLE